MSADAIRITSRANLHAVADRVALIGAPQAPIYAAAAAGRIGLVVIENPATSWPAELVENVRRPVLVLLSGDPGWGQPSYGPTRWRCAKRLKAWTTAAIVHGAAGEADHYREAAALTEMFGRLCFIETTSGLVRCWGAFLDTVPRIGYMPADGAHPVRPEAVQ
ncbi:MAG: hypothetical protein ACRYG8_08960 [Janthinobacterium lividum]